MPGKVPKFKIIIAGEGGVGKTTFVTRCTAGEYVEQDDITVGANFAVKKIPYNGTILTFQLWDFAGEERFRFLIPAFCRGTAGGFICFDLTRPPTMEVLPQWLSLIRKKTGNIPLLLLGFKSDMMTDNYPLPCVDHEFGVNFAKEHNLLGFLPISSKEATNINQAFHILAKTLHEEVETVEIC